MKHKSYMTISEFAHITGIKRANLIFYDNIGLLSPEFREANNYRCYTRQQLSSAYLITALRELGLSLDEIRLYAKDRSPDNLLSLLSEQKHRVQDEIQRLHSIEDMMGLYTAMAEEGLTFDPEQVILREQKREPIFLGEPVSETQNDEEGSIAFYQSAADKGLALGYPMGCIINKGLLDTAESWTQQESEKFKWVYRYYFKVKYGQNAWKPKGLYAVACGYCGYGQAGFLYKRLFDYINKHDLQICGDVYEEYPLNEMAIKDDNRYLTKVEIMVAHKSS